MTEEFRDLEDQEKQEMVERLDDFRNTFATITGTLGGFSFVGISILLTLERRDAGFQFIFVVNTICSLILISISILSHLQKYILADYKYKNAKEWFEYLGKVAIFNFFIACIGIIAFWIDITALSALVGVVPALATAIIAIIVIVATYILTNRYINSPSNDPINFSQQARIKYGKPKDTQTSQTSIHNQVNPSNKE
jgi:hypothetical protein